MKKTQCFRLFSVSPECFILKISYEIVHSAQNDTCQRDEIINFFFKRVFFVNVAVNHGLFKSRLSFFKQKDRKSSGTARVSVINWCASLTGLFLVKLHKKKCARLNSYNNDKKQKCKKNLKFNCRQFDRDDNVMTAQMVVVLTF